MSQPFEVTSKTARTVQICSQTGDTANNSLQLEAARGTVMHANHFPPPVEVLGGKFQLYVIELVVQILVE